MVKIMSLPLGTTGKKRERRPWARLAKIVSLPLGTTGKKRERRFSATLKNILLNLSFIKLKWY